MNRDQNLRMTVVFGLILCASVANANSNDNPPPLAGWSRSTSYADDAPLKHGILLAGGYVVGASALIAEIDGDTANGKEVAIGGDDGTLYVYKADGTLHWSVDVTPQACTSSSITSQPAVGDLHGDGTLSVVLAYESCDGGVAAYDGTTGELGWNFSPLAWRESEGYAEEGLYSVRSSPALADTEGDGTLEVAFGGFDRNLYLLNHDGTVRWYYHAADTIWSSPVFMNVDEDGPLEVVIGTDIMNNPLLDPPETDGGFVYAFDSRSRNSKRIEFRTGFDWRTPNLGQAIYSSPSLGDVLETNTGDEIVIGSGCFYPAGSADKTGKWVKILRPSDGEILQTLTVPTGGTCIASSPALGDIDDDGKLEVVVTMGSESDTGGDGLGRIVAWDPETPTPKWSTVVYAPNLPASEQSGNDGNGGDIQSAVIADLDGNGSLEVVAANFWSVHVLAGSDGTPLTCQNQTCGSQISMFTWGTLKSTPAIGDVDGDGDLEVIIGGMHIWGPTARGHLYAWTDFAGLLGSAAGSQPAYSAPWPMFRSNSAEPGTAGEPFEPETPTDPCEDFDEGSDDRLACEIEEFLNDPPCDLTRAVQKRVQKAMTALAATTDASAKKVRKLRKRARKRLAAGRRKVRLSSYTPECRTAVRSELREFINQVRTLLKSR